MPPELRTLCKKERKVDPRQEYKFRGQAVAALLHKYYPELTIEQIIYHPDFLEVGNGQSVEPETRIKWLTECGINKRGRGAPKKINSA